VILAYWEIFHIEQHARAGQFGEHPLLGLSAADRHARLLSLEDDFEMDSSRSAFPHVTSAAAERLCLWWSMIRARALFCCR
jgi:hypothetical protein